MNISLTLMRWRYLEDQAVSLCGCSMKMRHCSCCYDNSVLSTQLHVSWEIILMFKSVCSFSFNFAYILISHPTLTTHLNFGQKLELDSILSQSWIEFLTWIKVFDFNLNHLVLVFKSELNWTSGTLSRIRLELDLDSWLGLWTQTMT